MVDQYQGLEVGAEQKEKDRLEREMVDARRRAASQYEQGMGASRTAMDRGNMLTRQYAAGNLGRAQGFTGSGGGAMRAGLGAGMQAAQQIASTEQTGVGRLMDMGVNLGQLQESASTGAREMMKSDQRMLKIQQYMQTYQEVLDKQGLDEARLALYALLGNETDPVTKKQVELMILAGQTGEFYQD